MKKIILAIFLLLLVGACTPRQDAQQTRTDIKDWVSYIFNLEFVTGDNPAITFVAFTRMVIVLILFFAVFELFAHAPVLKDLSKRTALVASLALAILVGVFFPPALLITIAITYSAFFGFIMVGIPSAIAIWLAYSYEPETNKGYLMRALLLLLAWWMVGIMVEYSQSQLPTGGRNVVAALGGVVGAAAVQALPEAGPGVTRTLEALETFGNWVWWILLALILLNASKWLFGAGKVEEAAETVRGHGTGFFDSIKDAIGARAEAKVEAIAEKIRPEEQRKIETRMKTQVNAVVTRLDDANTSWDVMPGISAVTDRKYIRSRDSIIKAYTDVRNILHDKIAPLPLTKRITTQFSATANIRLENSRLRVAAPRITARDDLPTYLVNFVDSQISAVNQATRTRPVVLTSTDVDVQKRNITFIIDALRVLFDENKA
ncbi:hypothetical protein HY490_04020 [Candidatus Woesearchaeota archaeon]|nr:hypothetical protein [Candidatus Woesearchaeota archaeon]